MRTAIWDTRKRLVRVLFPALIGIPLGVRVLSMIDLSILKIVIAGFLILYGGFFSLRRTLPRFERPVVDVIVGFAGGVRGGAASQSGALPTMWFAMRPWPKHETRGVYTGQTLLYLAICFPVTLFAAQLGIWNFKRLEDDQFRRILILLSFASGVQLMLRELF